MQLVPISINLQRERHFTFFGPKIINNLLRSSSEIFLLRKHRSEKSYYSRHIITFLSLIAFKFHKKWVFGGKNACKILNFTWNASEKGERERGKVLEIDLLQAKYLPFPYSITNVSSERSKKTWIEFLYRSCHIFQLTLKQYFESLD